MRRSGMLVGKQVLKKTDAGITQASLNPKICHLKRNRFDY